MLRSALFLGSLLMAATAAQAAEPVSIGVAEIGFLDSTGAPEQKVKKARTERAKKLAEALRKDLGADGKFKVVDLDCGAEPCSIANQTPEDLIAAAKKAGVRILVYGGVHKLSAAKQSLQAQAVDIDAAKLVLDHPIDLGRDNDAAWKKAERDLAEALLQVQLPEPLPEAQ